MTFRAAPLLSLTKPFLSMSDDGTNEDTQSNNFPTTTTTSTSSSSSSLSLKRSRDRAMLALGSSVGLSRTEASSFLDRYPELYSDENRNISLMSKLTYFLTDLGLDRDDLKRMILQQPGLMTVALLDDDLKSSIEVLQSDLELSMDDVWNLATVSFPKMMRYNRSELRQKLAFFRVHLKMTDDELKSFVLTQPSNLEKTPKSLMEVIHVLKKELGMSAWEMKRMVLRFPVLFMYHPTNNLRPTIQFLKGSDVGVGLGSVGNQINGGVNVTTMTATEAYGDDIVTERTKTILMKFPNILGFSVEKKLSPIIRFFREEVGCTPAQLAKIVWRLPEVLGFSLDNNLRPKINYLKETLGMSTAVSDEEDGDIAALVTRNPNVFSMNLKRNLIPKLNYFFTELLFSREELCAFLVERPQTLSLSLENNIIPKVNYYLFDEDVGLSREELKRFIVDKPGQLSFNLETRIKPRIKALKKCGIHLRDAPVTIISRSDGSFQKWVLENSKGVTSLDET